MKAPQSDKAKRVLKKGDAGRKLVEKLHESNSNQKIVRVDIGGKKYVLKQLGI